MGAEESRNGNYGLMCASAVVANLNKQVQSARPWSLLHQCSLDQWNNGHGGEGGGGIVWVDVDMWMWLDVWVGVGM